MNDTKDTQINFPINIKQENSINTLSKSWNKQIIHAGAIPFYRSFFYVFSIVFTFLTLIFLSVQLYQNYSLFPQQVPLIYSHALEGWELINKEYIIIFILGFLLFAILFPIVNSKIYFFDKRLVLIMNIAVIIIDCLLLISFSEIFSLLLL